MATCRACHQRKELVGKRLCKDCYVKRHGDDSIIVCSKCGEEKAKDRYWYTKRLCTSCGLEEEWEWMSGITLPRRTKTNKWFDLQLRLGKWAEIETAKRLADMGISTKRSKFCDLETDNGVTVEVKFTTCPYGFHLTPRQTEHLDDIHVLVLWHKNTPYIVRTDQCPGMILGDVLEIRAKDIQYWKDRWDVIASPEKERATNKGHRKAKIITCKKCRKRRKHRVSGLCSVCYYRRKGKEYLKRFRNRFKKDTSCVMVRDPDNPMADKRGYVRRARLVMAEKIGRPLTRKEIVYHIDGDGKNDDPSNLMLFESTGNLQKYLHEKEMALLRGYYTHKHEGNELSARYYEQKLEEFRKSRS